jgi:argininosuccinate lyase
MQFNKNRLEALAPQGFSLATDIAEWLVKKKIPFRDAHEITGKMVALCEQRGIELHEVPDADMAAISPHLTPDVRDVLTVGGSIKARAGAGGTALPRVLEQIAALRKIAPKREA